MRPKSILIIGNYGAGNLGDDAILGGILTDLKTLGCKGKIEVMHGGFHSSQEIYKHVEEVPFMPAGIRSFFSKKRKKAAMDAIKRADLVILGGGGLFTDSETGKAPLIWALQMYAVMRLNKPYICYGQSVGPLKSWFAKRITKRVFKGANGVCVRDHISAALLKKMGVENVITGTDPAFSWLTANLASVKKRVEKEDTLLISLRRYNKKTRAKWQAIIDGAVAFAKKKHLRPVIIAMDVRDEKELKDLRSTGLEVIAPPSANLAFQEFVKAKYAVTMRLHAGIFALAAKNPLLALSYSHKVSGLFKSLPSSGVEIIKMDHLSKGKLKRAFKKLASQKRSSLNLEKATVGNRDFLASELELR